MGEAAARISDAGAGAAPPERSPDAIRAVLATYAGQSVVEEFRMAWVAATEAARDQLSLEPINQCLDVWRLHAYDWARDPAARREFLARVDRYLAEGPPPASERVTAEEFQARYGL